MAGMKSRMLYVVLVLALVLVFTSACGSKKAGDTGTPAPATESASVAPSEAPSAEPSVTTAPEDTEDHTPVTIQFANWAGSDTYAQVNAAFMRKYPWITVQWMFLGDVEKSIASGRPIDVWFAQTFGDVYAKNLEEDLTPYIAKDAAFKAYNFLPGVNEQYNINGKQLAITRGTEAFLVYYNKELMEEYGLTKPGYDWSWEDLRTMAIKATDPSKKRYGFGQVGITTQFGPQTIPVANGHAKYSYMLDENYNSISSNPDVLADLGWFRDLIDKDKVLLDAKAAKAAGVTTDLWSTGQALFTIHVSPLMENWDKSLKFAWDVMPFPKGTTTQTGLIWEQPLMMSKAGTHKDASWKFISFFTTSKEAQNLFYSNATLLPNTPDENIADLLKSLPFYKKYDVDALIYAVNHGAPDPTNSMIGGDLVAGDWAAYVGATGTDGTTPFDYFPKTNEKLNKDLADRRAQVK